MKWELIALEDEVARELPPVRWEGSPPIEYLRARDAWAEAVWLEAVAKGYVPIEQATLERGKELCSRVVFLCGVHRSGTTLLRDLLDGHPNLSVLPSEGSYFTNLYPRILRLPQGDAQAMMAKEWVGRIVNPINQTPFWLLGRSTEERSPYVDFVRSLISWWSELDRTAEVSRTSTPHLAVMLASASALGGGTLSEDVRRLVEKTPAVELSVNEVRNAFPGARFIQVVRHPYSILASRKQAEERATGGFRCERQALDQIKRSFGVATRESGQSDYLVVRYEDLIALPWEETLRIATFLGIETDTVMLTPSVAGRPTFANSSFAESAPSGTILGSRVDHSSFLTRRERYRVAREMGSQAAQFGYTLT